MNKREKTFLLVGGIQGCLVHQNTPPVRPYSSPVPRDLWGSLGDGYFLMGEVPLYWNRVARMVQSWVDLLTTRGQSQETCRRTYQSLEPLIRERDFFIDNLLVQMHFIIKMIWWTGLAPWQLEFPFPGRLISTFPFITSPPLLSGNSRSTATLSIVDTAVLVPIAVSANAMCLKQLCDAPH